MHKVLSSTQGWRAKNDYYYGPFNQRSEGELGKRTFLIRQFLLVKNDRQRLKTEKKVIAPTCPQILMISPINMDTNVPYFQKISRPFFDLGKIFSFDSFFDGQKIVKTEYLA